MQLPTLLFVVHLLFAVSDLWFVGVYAIDPRPLMSLSTDDYNKPKVKFLLGQDGHDLIRRHHQSNVGMAGHGLSPFPLSSQKEKALKSEHKIVKKVKLDQFPWHKKIDDFTEGDLVHLTPGAKKKLKKMQSAEFFKMFLKKYKKSYNNTTEYMHRQEIFRKNMKKVLILMITERGSGKYGATEFADLDENEFKQQKLGLNMNGVDNSWMGTASIPNVDLPKEFDWRTKGAVTAVKNQGSCGSCWAFSVTGNVEGQWRIFHQKLISLSEQELIDCDSLDHGCQGGLPTNAYKSIIKLGGLESEKDYGYEGEDEEICHFEKTKVKATISGAVNISQNETQMAQWLLKNGPISIGLNANAMQFYMGGVSNPFKFLCSPKNIDHGVLLVGFGVHHYPLFHRDLPYWIIKNSWGENWGEQGYYRLHRGSGACGVNKMATSALLS